MKILGIERLPAPYSHDWGADSSRTPESEDCVSVSTVKDFLAAKHGFNNYEADFSSPAMQLKAWMGIAFEDRLSKDLARTEPDRVPWPGELFSPSGRVMGHPEGFYFASGGLTVGDIGVDEFKHTYTSSRNYSDRELLEQARTGMVWHYLFQLRSYVALLRASGFDCREGRLFTLCPMGDWKEEREPLFHMARFEWEERELDAHLHLLEADARRAWAWKQETGGK